MNLTLWQVDSLVQKCTNIINLINHSLVFRWLLSDCGSILQEAILISCLLFLTICPRTALFSQGTTRAKSLFVAPRPTSFKRSRPNFFFPLTSSQPLQSFWLLGAYLHCSGNWYHSAVGMSKLALIQVLQTAVLTAGPWDLSSLALPGDLPVSEMTLMLSLFHPHCCVSPVSLLGS